MLLSDFIGSDIANRYLEQDLKERYKNIVHFAVSNAMNTPIAFATFLPTTDDEIIIGASVLSFPVFNEYILLLKNTLYVDYVDCNAYRILEYYLRHTEHSPVVSLFYDGNSYGEITGFNDIPEFNNFIFSHNYKTHYVFHNIFDDGLLTLHIMSPARFNLQDLRIQTPITYEKFCRIHFIPRTYPITEYDWNNMEETSILMNTNLPYDTCFAQIKETANPLSNCSVCPHYYDCLFNVLQYNRKPNIKFYHNDGEVTKTERKNTTYFGVELELELEENWTYTKHYNKVRGKGDDMLDFLYAKHDGSLTFGYELVTQPAELDYLKEHLTTAVSRITDATSHDRGTCGFHIHINKKNLTEKDIANVMQIVYSNWESFVRFSRRRQENLNNWCRYIYIDDCYDDTPRKILGKEENGDRYVAVNITNPDTIELRLFRGTLKMNTLLATLNLVDNLIKIAKNYSFEKGKKVKFMDVVNYNEGAELKQYLTERGMYRR